MSHSSTSTALNSSTYAELVDLGRRLYEQSLVRRETEFITDPRGHPIGWLLDTRIPMLNGSMFKEVGEVLGDRLRAKGVSQVAGYGFGAYSLVCAVLAASGEPAFRGGFIRDQPKKHGRRRLVEGPLDRSQPVVLLDDILNSGRSAVRAITLLKKDDFDVVGVTTLFNFTWSGGRNRVESEGLWVDSLLDLNLRESTHAT
ncbi:MAG: orotate phosphoribosyltransferase [Rhodothermales bacterium]|nr:orotate phosphoribosyltransferase [Rhodothermales bacterium]